MTAFFSSPASRRLNCSTVLSSVCCPFCTTIRITSPLRTSTRASGRTSVTTSPPDTFRSFFCSAEISVTTMPRRLAATGAGFAARGVSRAATRSSGRSSRVMVMLFLAALRQTSMPAWVPGRAEATRRSRSLTASTGRPLNDRMMSLASTPARSAGLALSTQVSRAPPVPASPNKRARDGEVTRRRAAGVELEQRHVGQPVGADHLGLVLALVGEAHHDLLGLVHHVGVGEDVAVAADDEARADRAAFGALARPGQLPRNEAPEEFLRFLVVHARHHLRAAHASGGADIAHRSALLIDQAREIGQLARLRYRGRHK